MNFWETLIRHKSNNPLLHEVSVFLQTVFPVSVALFLLHGLNIGLSTPTIRTFSSACPYPNPTHFCMGFRSHVFLEYVLAYISPPNHILNQCTMLCHKINLTFQIESSLYFPFKILAYLFLLLFLSNQ